MVTGISIFNCLWTLLGAGLALFEYSAAKRREFLYLYMTFGKPDPEYFQEARQRRQQFWRLLLVFLILVAKAAANLVGWLLFPMNSPVRMSWDRSLAGNVSFGAGEIAGAVLLGYALLTGPRLFSDRARTWLMGNLFLMIVLPILIALGCITQYASLQWLNEMHVIVLLTSFSAYLLVDLLLVRTIIDQYVETEEDRHRLERERQVVVSFVQTMAGELGTKFELDHVLEMIMTNSLRATSALAGAIFLFDESGRLQAKTSRGFFPPMYDDTEPEHRARRTEILQKRMLEQQFNVNEGIIGEAARTGNPMLVEDVNKAGIMTDRMTEFMRNRSMVVVPLMLQTQILGVMAVLNHETATPFTNDDQSMLQALADHAAFAIQNAAMVKELAEKERIDRELQIAHHIQQQLLPKECPQLPGFEVAALGEAAQEVGGDYYDFFWIDANRLGIVVADVSGKGIPAAMTMAIIRGLFRSNSTTNRTAREVISAVNAIIFPDLRRDMFVTAFYGILDVSQRTLTWCRAGHEPVLAVSSQGELEIIAPKGPALGIAEEAEFNQMIEENALQFTQGDTVLIYTDGITEAMNSHREEFGLERLKETVRSNGASSGDEMVKKVERAIRSFVGLAPQHDDMTLVLLKAR